MHKSNIKIFVDSSAVFLYREQQYRQTTKLDPKKADTVLGDVVSKYKGNNSGTVKPSCGVHHQGLYSRQYPL